MLFPNLHKPSFLREIHALRGLGAVCIVFFHLAPIGHISLPDSAGFIHHYFGKVVVLFFVLSGFSLYLTASSRAGAPGWVGRFYVKRFFRIAPLFYFALVLRLAYLYYGYGKPVDYKELLVNVFFVFNFVPAFHRSIVMAGWVIGIEAVFYVVFPALLVAISGRQSRIILMLLLFAVMSFAARTWFTGIDGVGRTFAYMNPLTHFIGFGTGIWACYQFRSILPERRNRLVYTSMSVLTLCLVLIIGADRRVGILAVPFSVWVPVYSAVFGALILAMLSGGFRFLANRLTVGLGELSYSIFLMHPLVLVLLRPVFRQVQAATTPLVCYLSCALMTFAVVTPLSYVTYRLIEVEGMKLGNRLLASRV